MGETTGQQVKDIDMIEDAMTALEAVEQLLCIGGTGHRSQMHDVHADNFATLIYMIRDRMFQGVHGITEREFLRRQRETEALMRGRSAA